MKCQSCGYPLWNLKQPRCPECGEHFAVTAWRFKSGTVRFRCPECEALLDADEPGAGWTRCSACRHRFSWRSVMVEPVSEDAERCARLRDPNKAPQAFAWNYAVIIAGLAIIIGCFWPVVSGRREPPSSLALFILLGLGAAIAGVGVLLADRKRRKMNIAIWSVLFAMWTSLQMYHAVSRHIAQDRWVWNSSTRHDLGSLHPYLSRHMEQTGEFPSHFYMLTIDGVSIAHPELFVSYKSDCVFDESSILPDITLDDLATGAVTYEQLADRIAQLPADESEWERIGDRYLCRDPDAWASRDAQLIVALSTTSPFHDRRLILYSDGHVDWEPGRTNWIKEQNDQRTALGFAPLPPLPE
jgi:hypothetical protein